MLSAFPAASVQGDGTAGPQRATQSEVGASPGQNAPPAERLDKTLLRGGPSESAETREAIAAGAPPASAPGRPESGAQVESPRRPEPIGREQEAGRRESDARPLAREAWNCGPEVSALQ